MWQIIIDGPRYFETTLFLPHGVTAIGRAPENELVLEGSWVSRHHAQFDVQGENLYVIDLGSRNGLLVNGRRLEGTALLRPGDVITLGEHTLTVRQPAKVENTVAPTVDLRAGGVRRLGRDVLPVPQVIAERAPGENRFVHALESLTPEEERRGDTLPRNYRTLILLAEAAQNVSGAGGLQAFLDEVTTWSRNHLKAESAIILLKHLSGVLVPVAVKHQDRLTQGEVPVADALLEIALSQGKAVAVELPPMSSGAERTRAVCVPIPVEGRDSGSGALYLNFGRRPLTDSADLLDAADALATLVASAVERFSRQDKHERELRLRKTLERFHAPQILEKRVKELARAGAKPTQLEERQITVLMADLSGFTALTAKMRPDRVVDILDEFYERMGQVLFSFEGTIDKFMGDSVLALFGAPYARTDDAVRAVRCAFALRSEWQKAMNRRPPEERCHLQLGLSTGRALVGTIGSEARLDYTAIGEPVNLASWACGAAGPGEVLVTDGTVKAVGDKFERFAVGEKTIKKMRQKVPMFELVESASPALDPTELGRPLKMK